MAIELRHEDRVAILTINRPEALNALSSSLLEEFRSELHAISGRSFHFARHAALAARERTTTTLDSRHRNISPVHRALCGPGNGVQWP